ncbi:hypothetical protein V8C86DRAFT_3087047 [Haematococcus lacustris]
MLAHKGNAGAIVGDKPYHIATGNSPPGPPPNQPVAPEPLPPPPPPPPPPPAPFSALRQRWRPLWPLEGGPPASDSPPSPRRTASPPSGALAGRDPPQPGEFPPLPGQASQTAKRLYKNDALRALVEQQQALDSMGRWGPAPPPSSQAPQSAGRGQQDPWRAAPPGQPTPSTGQQSQWGVPGQGFQGGGRGGEGEEAPPVPGFWAGREETAAFLAWMERQRARREEQRQAQPDTEVAGIARLYLVLALLVIVLGLGAL